jgi:uncharacterized protein (DUF885 family)
MFMLRPAAALSLAGLFAACATSHRAAGADDRAASSATAAAPPVTASAASPNDPAAQVTAIANEFVMQGLARAPEIGTQLGLPFANHAGLSNNTLAAAREWEEIEDRWLDGMRAVDPEQLHGRPESITYGFMLEQLESSVQSRACRNELWGVSQMFGWHTQYPFLASIQPLGTPQLRTAALARYGALPAFIDTEIAKLREGVGAGYTAPRGNVERVLEQMDALLALPVDSSPYLAMARRDSTPAFVDSLRSIVADRINPAYARYRDYLRNEYLPVSRTSVAVAALPNGEECYRARVRGFTTLDIAPRVIHETGLRQMRLIQEEMRVIAQRSFSTSDVPALLQRFKTEPQYTFTSRQEIIAYAQQAVDRARAEMGNWFGRLPQADVRIEPYAEYEERSAPGASYNSPADDGSRPGIYRINTYQPEQRSRAGMESTAFHEAIPGHHLQIAIAQERRDAHPVTRFLGNSGFSEGWALYAERLSDEMGLFSSDLDRMGLLSNEAFRAARLVVDPAIHVLGWSRQQAIDYMVAHTAMTVDEVETEVDRYIIWPGQATAYMIGSLEIMRLREMAERELGSRFDIREFHDRVLEDGGVTLPMLQRKIERWVAERRSTAER